MESFQELQHGSPSLGGQAVQMVQVVVSDQGIAHGLEHPPHFRRLSQQQLQRSPRRHLRRVRQSRATLCPARHATFAMSKNR